MTRFALPLLAAALLIGAGCYKDDTTSPLNGKPRARVLLTDAPFPYDSVASVNVYVASIDASRDIDTTGGGAWVRVATPPIEGKVVRGDRGLDVGDHVRVRLSGVDVERGFIDFERTAT